MAMDYFERLHNSWVVTLSEGGSIEDSVNEILPSNHLPAV